MRLSSVHGSAPGHISHRFLRCPGMSNIRLVLYKDISNGCITLNEWIQWMNVIKVYIRIVYDSDIDLLWVNWLELDNWMFWSQLLYCWVCHQHWTVSVWSVHHCLGSQHLESPPLSSVCSDSLDGPGSQSAGRPV